MKTAMKDYHVYFADNGRRICTQCAGQSALWTGRDISGQKIRRATIRDAFEWQKEFKTRLVCECGNTAFGQFVR